MPFQCFICSRRVALLSNLRKHMKTHSKEKLYECFECHDRFKRLDSLKEHLRTHSGERPFSCPQCPLTFAGYALFYKHRKTHGPPPEKKHKCPTCNKCFRINAQLKIHMRVHTEGIYPCLECGKICPRLDSLDRHMKSHEKKCIEQTETHTCDICFKNYPSLRNLKIHQVIHTGLYYCTLSIDNMHN